MSFTLFLGHCDARPEYAWEQAEEIGYKTGNLPYAFSMITHCHDENRLHFDIWRKHFDSLRVYAVFKKPILLSEHSLLREKDSTMHLQETETDSENEHSVFTKSKKD